MVLRLDPRFLYLRVKLCCDPAGREQGLPSKPRPADTVRSQEGVCEGWDGKSMILQNRGHDVLED